MGVLDRLGRIGLGVTEEQVTLFTRLLFLHLFTERAYYLILQWDTLSWGWRSVPLVGGTAAFAIAFLLHLRPRWRPLAMVLAIAAVTWTVVAFWPRTGNHLYLELQLLLVLAIGGASLPREQVVGALGWVAIMVYIFAGIQKVVHGYYLDGSYLAFQYKTDADFRPILETVMSAADRAKLDSFRNVPGDGPYLGGTTLLVLANLAWLGEVAVGVGLLWRRTRVLSVIAAGLLLIGIEVFAHEVFFGAVLLNATLLFAPLSWHRVGAWILAAVYAWLLLMQFGLFPKVAMH